MPDTNPTATAENHQETGLAAQASRILREQGEEPMLRFLADHTGEEDPGPPPDFSGSLLLQDGTMVSVLQGSYLFEDHARMQLPNQGIQAKATHGRLAQVFHRRIALAEGWPTETNVWAHALHQLQPHHSRDRRAAVGEEESYRLAPTLRELVRRHSAEYDHSNSAFDELVADLSVTGRWIADDLPQKEAEALRNAIRENSQP